MMKGTLSQFLLVAFVALEAHAFVPSPSLFGLAGPAAAACSSKTAISLSDSDDFAGTSTATQERIAALVEEHPVLLFMKGSKLFPQCGFSNTATQILQSYNIDFHTVDVLAGSLLLLSVYCT